MDRRTLIINETASQWRLVNLSCQVSLVGRQRERFAPMGSGELKPAHSLAKYLAA